MQSRALGIELGGSTLRAAHNRLTLSSALDGSIGGSTLAARRLMASTARRRAVEVIERQAEPPPCKLGYACLHGT